MAYIRERLYGTLGHLLAFLSWLKRLYEHSHWEEKRSSEPAKASDWFLILLLRCEKWHVVNANVMSECKESIKLHMFDEN